MSYFAAKGENLAEVTEILKENELDGQELLAEEVEDMFQEILDETSHGTLLKKIKREAFLFA